jgi:hypothetical protein
MNITYYSNCDTDYVKAVKSCKSLAELKQIVTEYREMAEDAYTEVAKMDDPLFEQFCKGRNRLKPSMKWMKVYGPVLLPRVILEIGLIAITYHVPFGAAYIRVKELQEKNNV